MGKVKYHISLNETERDMLKRIIRGASPKAQKTKRAKILLLWSESYYTVHEIATRVNCCPSTVSNIKKRYNQFGFQDALSGKIKGKKR